MGTIGRVGMGLDGINQGLQRRRDHEVVVFIVITGGQAWGQNRPADEAWPARVYQFRRLNIPIASDDEGVVQVGNPFVEVN